MSCLIVTMQIVLLVGINEFTFQILIVALLGCPLCAVASYEYYYYDK